MGVDTYLAVVFWLGILGVILKCVNLTQDHPRQKSVNIGEDVLSLLLTVAFLAWVSILRYGS